MSMSAAMQKLIDAKNPHEFVGDLASEIRARADDPVALRAMADELDGHAKKREDEMRQKQNEASKSQDAETGAAQSKAWSGGAKVMAGDQKSEVPSDQDYPGEGERKTHNVEPAGGKDNSGKAKSAK